MPETGAGEPAAMPDGGGGGGETTEEVMWRIRKYLILLAILAASVAYVAGMNPPGGVWPDTAGEHVAGDSILRDSNRTRYLAFYYCNATAFAASLVLILLVLIPVRVYVWHWLRTLQFVMLLDMLGLLGAYAAGSCRKTATSIIVSVLVAVDFLYILFHIATVVVHWKMKNHESPEPSPAPAAADAEVEEKRNFVMCFTVFAASIAYLAGLTPPGGFFTDGDHAGDFVLSKNYGNRFRAFFVCNAVAFVVSLVTIVLLLTKRLSSDAIRTKAVSVTVAVNLCGLMGAFAAGSSRDLKVSIYVLALIAPTFLLILFLVVTKIWSKFASVSNPQPPPPTPAAAEGDGAFKSMRSYYLLLAILAASITFQAGLNPPGGWWSDEAKNRLAPAIAVLQKMNPARYSAFFFCNATAFVASLGIIVLLLVKSAARELHNRGAVQLMLVVVMFGLVGAYAAGSSRTLDTTIYMCVWAAAVFIYVVFFVLRFILKPGHDQEHQTLDKNTDRARRTLLTLGILAASVTYQAGLVPPGGFWTDNNGRHRIGNPVFFDQYHGQYTVFLYLNATSFMASVSIVMVLARSRFMMFSPAWTTALHFLIGVDLCCLLGSFAAGSTVRIKTSIYALALVAAAFAYFAIHFFVLAKLRIPAGEKEDSGGAGSRSAEEKEEYRKRKRLMLLGTLAASATYQAGLNPPGGIWTADGNGHVAGDPVLKSYDHRSWNVFFCCNATAFMASIVVITLLMSRRGPPGKYLIPALKTAMLFDLLGLLGAFAAGSSRTKEQYGYVIVACVLVVVYLAFHVLQSAAMNEELRKRVAEGTSCFRWRTAPATAPPSPARSVLPLV